MSDFYYVRDDRLQTSPGAPVGLIPIVHAQRMLTPALVSELHRNFKAWESVGLSPGPIVPQHVFVGAQGEIAFHFHQRQRPRPVMANVGLAPDLAAWLVLLDKWMETFVVVARARALWPTQALAQALPFVTPAFLPAMLVACPPDNWVRIARALAQVAAEGDLPELPDDPPPEAAGAVGP